MSIDALPEKLEDYKASGTTYLDTGATVLFGIDSDGCVDKGMRHKHGGPFPRARHGFCHLSRPEHRDWHPVDSASAYQLMVDNSTTFSSPLISTPLADTTFTPVIDLPEGTIYWKVKSNLSETYSALENFYIQNDSIPFLYGFNQALIK